MLRKMFKNVEPPMVLFVGGVSSFVFAAFTFSTTAGWAVAGVAFLLTEYRIGGE